MLERVYFHYTELEEYHAGMWRLVYGDEKKANSLAAANLMRDSKQFDYHMRRAFDEWPNSCVHNLTSENSNRVAWLGHAGCFLGTGSTEENTRCGWHTLNEAEKAEANRVAGDVLSDWCDSHEVLYQPSLLPLMNGNHFGS
jgi:hypothetical protein